MVDTALVELLLRAGATRWPRTWPHSDRCWLTTSRAGACLSQPRVRMTSCGIGTPLDAGARHRRIGDPTTGDATITVVGDLPPGLPISAVSLVLSVDNGQLTELLQEVVPAITEPDPNIDIGPAVRELIDSAFRRGSPFSVAYVDESGAPHLSYRGSLQSHGPDTLAMWVRDPAEDCCVQSSRIQELLSLGVIMRPNLITRSQAERDVSTMRDSGNSSLTGCPSMNAM